LPLTKPNPDTHARNRPQVAEEHGLELAIGLPGAGTSVAAQATAETDLKQRLAGLR